MNSIQKYQSNGDILPRGLGLQNCKTAAQDILREESLLTNPYQHKTTLYPLTADRTSRSVFMGEILFTVVEPLVSHQRSVHAPQARSCLNGIPLTSSDQQEQFAELWSKCRLLGFSLSNCMWNDQAPVHTNDPVAVLSGVLSSYNTSLYPIHAGDIIVATLPDVTRSSQAPLDNSQDSSPGRRVFETMPLRELLTFKMDPRAPPTGNTHKLFSTKDITSFARSKKLRHILRIMGVFRMGFIRAEENGGKACFCYLENGHVPDQAFKSNIWGDQETLETVLGGADTEIQNMMNYLIDDSGAPSVIALQLMEALVPMALILANKITSRQVACAITAAQPGCKVDLLINKPTNSFTKTGW